MSQILKFRLTDNNIFEIKYSKYSEFIDNLEPEPGVIIDVLEPFTLEDFETAQIEYNKYVVFKEALEDIIKNKKLWSKEELIELSKYDLNNPVLEWLMIRETREDKEIKEKLSLDSFELSQVNKDSIILYNIAEKTNDEFLSWACEKGHLEVAKWLYMIYQSSEFSLGGENINSILEIAFKKACDNGHLEVAKWLFSVSLPIGGIDLHKNREEIFRRVCIFGKLEVAKWLYNITLNFEVINIHIEDEYVFRHCCQFGHLHILKWLYEISLGCINIHIKNEEPFKRACIYGNLKIAQWLYCLGGVDIHIQNEYAFRWACKEGRLEVAQWLWSLGGFHKEGIKTRHQPIKDWLATLD